MNDRIWIVSICDDGDKEATVTAFDDEDAAKACYECFKLTHDKCAVDACSVHHRFYDGNKWIP